MKTCAWHECGRGFDPGDTRRNFCCPACQRARGSWKERRGAPLVDLLLTGDAMALIEAKRKITKEIADAVARNR